MSANGVFSATLEYEFFGGGFSTISGSVLGSIEPAFNSTAKTLIFGESTNNHVSFEFTSNAQQAAIDATASLDIDFTFTGTAEIGIAVFVESDARIEFTAAAIAYVPVKGSVDYTYSFNTDIKATQISFVAATASYEFGFYSKGLNYSTHVSDRVGKNGITFVANSNDVSLTNELTSVKFNENASNDVKILTY
jgi:hypothetical protein